MHVFCLLLSHVAIYELAVPTAQFAYSSLKRGSILNIAFCD